MNNLINIEYKRLKVAFFLWLMKPRKNLADNLIYQAAFMKVELH